MSNTKPRGDEGSGNNSSFCPKLHVQKMIFYFRFFYTSIVGCLRCYFSYLSLLVARE